MPITEINAHLKYKNTSGDTTVIYPITRVDNVIDLQAQLASKVPAFTYGTEDIVAGSTSDKPDGAIHFVYITKDEIWDRVKSIFISVDGVWRPVLDTDGTSSSDYTITTKLTSVTGDSSNPTTIAENGSAILTFTAKSGYALPDSVTVEGASYYWNKGTGNLILNNPTGNVTVNIKGVVETEPITPTTYTTSINYYLDGSLATTKTFSSTSYVTATKVTKSGATATVTLSNGGTSSYAYSSTLDSVTYENPSEGIITIYAVSEAAAPTTYTITTNLTGVTGASSNPTTIDKNGSAELTFTANTGYTLPDSVTIVNANYYWNSGAGKLILSNPRDNVTVTIKGEEGATPTTYNTNIKYYLNGSPAATKVITTTMATAYPTATAISTNDTTVTVTLSSGQTSSYIYSSTIDSATYENTSEGVISVYAISKTSPTYSTSIKYYFNGSLESTKTIMSSAYLTATNVSDSGTNVTVTLSNGGTDSYDYGSTLVTVVLDSVTYENTSEGVISVYAVSKTLIPTTYTTLIKYYLNNALAVTHEKESASGYLTATEVRNSGTNVTVTLSDGNTDSYDYSSTLDTAELNSVTYENTSEGVISIYAVSKTITPASYSTSIMYYLDGELAEHNAILSADGYRTVTNVSHSGATVTVTLSNGGTDSYTYSSAIDSVTYENTSEGVISVYAVSKTTYTTLIKYHLNGSLAFTHEKESTSAYLTATDVSNSGTNVTVTLSNGGTDSYDYSSTLDTVELDSVTYENTSEGVISVYAVSKTTYDNSIKYYLDGELVTTESITSITYVTATNVSHSGATVTVILSNGQTSSYIYSSTIDSATYENTSEGVISVYAVSKTTYTITTNLFGVTGDSSNPTTIDKDGSATLTFTANTGYTLPDYVTVEGASHEWNKSNGVLYLSDPTGDVTITIDAREYTTTVNIDGETVYTESAAGASPDVVIGVHSGTTLSDSDQYIYVGKLSNRLPTYNDDTKNLVGLSETSGSEVATYGVGKHTLSGTIGANTIINLYTVAEAAILYTTQIEFLIDGISTSTCRMTYKNFSPTVRFEVTQTGVDFINERSGVTTTYTYSGEDTFAGVVYDEITYNIGETEYVYGWDSDDTVVEFEVITWSVNDQTVEPLKFYTLDGSDFTVSTNYGVICNAEYSYDNVTWTALERGLGAETLSSQNGVIYLRGTNADFGGAGGINSRGIGMQFSEPVMCTGDLASMLTYSGIVDEVPARTFFGFFADSTNLLCPPNLPSTKLEPLSYEALFVGCTSMVVNTQPSDGYSREWRVPTTGTATVDTSLSDLSPLCNAFSNADDGSSYTLDLNTTYYIKDL